MLTLAVELHQHVREEGSREQGCQHEEDQEHKGLVQVRRKPTGHERQQTQSGCDQVHLAEFARRLIADPLFLSVRCTGVG